MEKIRTFIAIELEQELLKKLTDLQDRLKAEMPRGAVRWVRPEGIHLTLKFLGDVPAKQIQDIAQAVEQGCAEVSPFTLTVGGSGCYPNLRRPRVVWVGVEEPTGNLAALQRAIERHVAPLGYPTERRPFSPHLTLGRVKRQARQDERQAIGEAVAAAEVGALAEMAVAGVGVIRSDLRPSGAVYTLLADVPLAGEQR